MTTEQIHADDTALPEENVAPRPFRRLLTFLVAAVAITILLAAMYLLWQSRQGEEDLVTGPENMVNVVSPAPAPLLIPAENVLVQEGFEVNLTGWELSSEGQVSYAGGAIILNDNHLNGPAWARPHLRFDDFTIDLDSRWLSGAIGGNYGLHFRLQENGDHYAFYLRNDGWYTVGKVLNGEGQIITESFTQAIDRQGGVNHLRIEANGSHLRFFVNDIYLVDVADSSLGRGDVQLYVEKVEGITNMEVAFDNLVVGLYPE